MPQLLKHSQRLRLRSSLRALLRSIHGSRGSRMVRLKIKAAERTAKPGDFGASIEGSDLLLPEEIANVFNTYGLHEVTEILSYVDAFPSTIATDLHWSPSDVQDGLIALRQQLSGYVDEAFLTAKRGPQRRYGALPPPNWKSVP
jgi:hypothetical protein